VETDLPTSNIDVHADVLVLHINILQSKTFATAIHYLKGIGRNGELAVVA
jgi:hypothetical protein